MRVPQDAIPQRQLVYQLALAIDNCMETPIMAVRPCIKALDKLLDANPQSSFSTHVLHNIGSRRSRWLVKYQSARAARDASSA